MKRLLVAFEATPSAVEEATYEELWDDFVARLNSSGLTLPHDLDPVTVLTSGDSTFEVYEAVAL